MCGIIRDLEDKLIMDLEQRANLSNYCEIVIGMIKTFKFFLHCIIVM